MKKLATLILGMTLTGAGLPLAAQHSQSDTQPGQQQQQPSDQMRTPQEATGANSGESAQYFQGKIMRSGNQLVFQDSASQIAYQVDDSSKIDPYEGRM